MTHAAPTPGRLHAYAAIACGIALGGCTSEPEAVPNAVPDLPARAVYSELEPLAAATARLPTLSAHGLGVIRLVRAEEIRTPQLHAFFVAAARARVAVRAWLVLSEADGYWPGESNLDAFGRAVDAFLAWREDADVPVDWLTFDLEPSWQYTHELIAIGTGSTDPSRLGDLVALIQAHVDPPAFLAHRAALAAILARVHAAGMHVHCVTYPMVLDDLGDDDDDIQDGLDIPVRGLAWDEVSFMTYRSGLALYANAPFGPAFFEAFARDARAAFGDRAALDFGVVGADPLTGAAGYRYPVALAADLDGAAAGGVTKHHVYSLERAAAATDADAWLDARASDVPTVPPRDDGAESLRAVFRLLDEVLTH